MPLKVKNVIERERRAVLILNRTIGDANELSKRLLYYYEPEQIKNHTDNLSAGCCLNEYETKLNCGDIVIATNLAGRGTDICLSSELRVRGGLHVIITFMCKNLRVKHQGEGRGARQGEMVCLKTFFYSVHTLCFLKEYDVHCSSFKHHV